MGGAFGEWVFPEIKSNNCCLVSLLELLVFDVGGSGNITHDLDYLLHTGAIQDAIVSDAEAVCDLQRGV